MRARHGKVPPALLIVTEGPSSCPDEAAFAPDMVEQTREDIDEPAVAEPEPAAAVGDLGGRLRTAAPDLGPALLVYWLARLQRAPDHRRRWLRRERARGHCAGH